MVETWGFDRVGRHWMRVDLDITIEMSVDALAKSKHKLTTFEIENPTNHIISINNLIAHQLNAYVH